MPVSVVVGGQFGSEGKGKVALEIARRTRAKAAVRVGGTNSGHTVVSKEGQTLALRQLPGAVVDGGLCAVLPAGSYIDVDVLVSEISLLGLTEEQIAIDPFARIISQHHKAWEQESGLGKAIGSTQSGTGAAVVAAIARGASTLRLPLSFAQDHPKLSRYIKDTTVVLRTLLDDGERIVIEGTQGFGLSVLHSKLWPKVTSRDTTAAGFVAEAGLSPLDVDDVTLVIRAFPIRVSGNSGPLEHETSWSEIAIEAGISRDLTEHTTVTKKVRRVAHFDAEIVRRAILTNAPTRIVLNHLDYVEPSSSSCLVGTKARAFVEYVEALIGRRVDWLGLGPHVFVERT